MAVSLFAMATTLWMGFYLFARGFPRIMTLRVVIVLLALAGFFFGAYNNIFVQVSGSAAIRAVLLVIVLGGWYNVTFHMMPNHSQKRYRIFEWGIYALGAASTVLLLQPNTFLNEAGNALYVAHMSPGWAYRAYGAYQFIVSFGIMLNLLIDDRIGLTSRGKYFLVASIFPVISVVYGVFSLGSKTPTPRLIQDALAFCGVFVLGLSVARHQTLTERRTTFQDFPLTTLSTLGLVAVTLFFALRFGIPVENLAAVTGFIIITVGAYDLTREFLERLRMRREGAFRKQLRQLESVDENAFRVRLQEVLDLLCRTLNINSGMIAIRSGDEFLVAATRQSVPLESRISADLVMVDKLSRIKGGQLHNLEWIAPSFEGQTQVAVVAIEKQRSRLENPRDDLEMLEEVADQVGTMVSLRNLRPGQNEQIRQLVAQSRANASELNSIAGQIMDTISINPDEEFIRMVEDALRHLPDMIALGQSTLADKMDLTGKTHIERGRQLQQLLMDSIELLKPAEKRPPEPLPRVWYNHAVLYDAYVEGVPNREIMARLYISEGTFNRTRRNAIRGLARLLMEK
ncbi:MAG: hypothetical protein C3F07_19715 [Anaerolineales bacterium]|nr:MAG: hypothetical protein C3F07_19715 [Anaerolineales bacterium]